MASPTFRELLRSIKSENFPAPVYLLMGEEGYYIDTLVEAFENFTISEDERDFNQNIFYGNDTNVETVIATAQQYPVMAQRRLVILKEAQTIDRAKIQIEKLTPYIKRPNPNTILVIAYKGDKLPATSKLVKAFNGSSSIIFRSDPVKDWQLSQHIKEYCDSMGVKMEDKAVALISEYIGTPLSKLFGEINKLIGINGSAKRITAQDVETHVGISKAYPIFEFTKAIGQKDYPKTMKILKYYKNNPKVNPCVVIAGSLFSFFQRLVIAHSLPDKSDTSFAECLGVRNTPAMKELRGAMQSYSAGQSIRSIHYIRDFDCQIKGIGSYQNEYELLRDLIFKIFTNP